MRATKEQIDRLREAREEEKIDRLRAVLEAEEIDRLRAALREVEWIKEWFGGSSYLVCPSCKAARFTPDDKKPHKENCRIRQALGE